MKEANVYDEKEDEIPNCSQNIKRNVASKLQPMNWERMRKAQIGIYPGLDFA
jgi:hypothetical protein